jgi:hypothetical protein
MRLESS